jgi:hypothetical protein
VLAAIGASLNAFHLERQRHGDDEPKNFPGENFPRLIFGKKFLKAWAAQSGARRYVQN